ncbi:MAG: hypothetical protein LBC74_08430 [Planctomycetaceae bacterium]|jgi:hypothetical protein|nr:hypothetical protein [Planctomycetaceae bacterium]
MAHAKYIGTRLKEFAKFQEGWLNGRGKTFNSNDLQKLAKDFERYFAPDLPLPYLYPTPKGGVMAEWSFGTCEVSLEIELPSQDAYYHQIYMETKQDMGSELQLNNADAWLELNSKLQKIIVEQL